MTTYRPFVEYPLKYLECFPGFMKEFDLDVRKYLVNHDSSKYYEYKDKTEEFYSIIDAYEYFNDSYLLGIYKKEENEDEYDY
jgi:hypothetical protein